MGGGLPKLFRFSKSVLGKDPEAQDADGAFLRAMTSAKMKGKATILGVLNQQLSLACPTSPCGTSPPVTFAQSQRSPTNRLNRVHYNLSHHPSTQSHTLQLFVDTCGCCWGV